MTIDKDDLLNSIMESLDRIQHIKSEDIPGIDLYYLHGKPFEKYIKESGE